MTTATSILARGIQAWVESVRGVGFRGICSAHRELSLQPQDLLLWQDHLTSACAAALPIAAHFRVLTAPSLYRLIWLPEVLLIPSRTSIKATAARSLFDSALGADIE